jgi:RHS repeat-associated protein
MITKPAETEIVSYFHNDHLGTPQVLTNDSQNVVWKAAYTPFGHAEISTETVTNPFRLPGQYYDQETGLHYNYFRYYDPTTGRYVTPDPIGLEGGINLFGYTNNPVNQIDPLGLSYIIFDRSQGRLIIITERLPLAPTLEFSAANNVLRPNANPYQPEGNGPAPYGTFSMGTFIPHGNDPNSSYGIGSFPIILPLQIPFRYPRTGVALHSGHASSCDKAGRCGVNHVTEGCIRTTDDAIRILQFDPPKTITIQPFVSF